MSIGLKRVYLPASPDDGLRVLVDRLWPRGLSKDTAAIDLWLKDVAPSAPLRRWFGHDPERWLEFRRRYEAELADNAALRRLAQLAGDGDVMIVYAARDERYNHAVILRDKLEEAAETRRAAK